MARRVFYEISILVVRFFDSCCTFLDSSQFGFAIILNGLRYILLREELSRVVHSIPVGLK